MTATASRFAPWSAAYARTVAASLRVTGLARDSSHAARVVPTAVQHSNA